MVLKSGSPYSLNYSRFTIHDSRFTIHDSLSFELRLAFIDVSVKSFFCVFRLKQLLLQLALERQRRLKRNLRARLNAALDLADCTGRLVWRCKQRRVFRYLPRKLFGSLRIENLIDQSELPAALEIKKFARGHQLNRS